jgi:alanine racemase
VFADSKIEVVQKVSSEFIYDEASNMCTRPTWVEISRSRLLDNYRYLRELAGDSADMLAVVKANAYGHGLAQCAPILANAGAAWLGITSVEEGVEVRSYCPPSTRVLVLSGPWQGEGDALLEHDLTPVVWEPFHLDELEAAAAKRGLEPQSLAVHLEIDTGMARQGVPAPFDRDDSCELRNLLARFHPGSPLRLEGVMTHFSAADELDSASFQRQFSRLAHSLECVAAEGLTFQWLHAGASATLLAGKDLPPMREMAKKHGARLMFRPGLALYGDAPRFAPQGTPADESAAILKPVLAWKTRVISTRVIPQGETVSYNATFRAERATKLALLDAGYADGLDRRLSNRFALLVRGEFAPIAGRVCMDQCMLDVTDIPGVASGDEVVILGEQGTHTIDAYMHADCTGTIPWEVLTDIGHRVHRRLVD